MKKISVLLAGLGLIAFAANANAVNLLLNPDLDNVAVSTQANATPVSWSVTSSRSLTGTFNDGASSESFANVLQPTGQCSGSGCGLFFKAFQGDNPQSPPSPPNGKVSTILSQDVAGSAVQLTALRDGLVLKATTSV